MLLILSVFTGELIMPQTTKRKTPTRIKKKSNSEVMFSTLIDPDKYRSLRLLSAQIDTEIKQLIDEALDLLFAKHINDIPKLTKRS
jgi:hypothetical protein